VKARLLLLLAACTAACAHRAPGPVRLAESARPPASPAPVDRRAELEAAIRKEVEPLRSKDEVAAYLERLRARAVAQRQVTALELETGVAAIERFTPELGAEATQEWVGRFVRSMTELSQSYRQPPITPTTTN